MNSDQERSLTMAHVLKSLPPEDLETLQVYICIVSNQQALERTLDAWRATLAATTRARYIAAGIFTDSPPCHPLWGEPTLGLAAAAVEVLQIWQGFDDGTIAGAPDMEDASRAMQEAWAALAERDQQEDYRHVRSMAHTLTTLQATDLEAMYTGVRLCRDAYALDSTTPLEAQTRAVNAWYAALDPGMRDRCLARGILTTTGPYIPLGQDGSVGLAVDAFTVLQIWQDDNDAAELDA